MSKQQLYDLDAQLRAAPLVTGPQTIEQLRAGFATFMAQFPIPDSVRRTPTHLGGRPAVLVEPDGDARPGTILYFHGGSNIIGSPETAMALTAHLVARTGIRAISLDYRLGPEHPFPAGIEDGVAAYRELLDGGVAPETIVFAGDSAGGGLTVTTSLAARDAGLPLPAGLVAFSPGLDYTRSGASMETKNGRDPFFTPDVFARTGDWYIAGADPNQPLLAPAVLADLTGFPPILLQVGTNELLLDDSVRLAERARDADVDVILDITAEAPHVFQSYTDTVEEADQALDRAALFITQRLRSPVGAVAAG